MTSIHLNTDPASIRTLIPVIGWSAAIGFVLGTFLCACFVDTTPETTPQKSDLEELRQTVEQQARTLEEHRSWISDVRTFVIDADKTARSADSRVKDIEIRMGIRQAAPGSPEQCDEPQPTLADPPKPPAKEPEKPKPDEPAPKTLPTPTYTNRYRNNRMR